MSGRLKSGQLIVIEGMDGAGKKTQLDLLRVRLKKERVKTAVFDFPRYESFFGQLIGAYLRGELGRLKSNHPKLICLVYALDRWQVKEKLDNYLRQGYIVISNRYTTANLGHQLAKLPVSERKKMKRWIEELEYRILGLPRPDRVLYLDVPVQVGQKLVDKKKQRRSYSKKRDLHEKNQTYLNLVRQEFLRLVQEEGWIKVSCVVQNKLLSPREIHQKIWTTLHDLFHK